MRRSDRRRALRAAAAQATYRMPESLRADVGEPGKPKWNQLFPLGTFHNGGWPKEGVTVTDAFCQAMVENWEKRGKPELSVDYFHKGNDEDAPNEERISAGDIKDLDARPGEGLWALIDWTDAARAKILAREMKFISPEFHPNGMDGRTGQRQGPTLIGAGLVNNPAFKEMPRVAASEVTSPAVTEYAMNRAQIDAMLKAAGITLAAGASDADAAAALSKHVTETAKASADAAAALKAKETTDATAATALKASEDREKALKAELAEANTEKAKLGVRVANIEKIESDRQMANLVKRAVDEGRIVAGATDSVKKLAAAAGLEEATKFVDSFTKGSVVQLGKVGIDGAGEDETSVDVKALQAKYDAELDSTIKADGQGLQAAAKKVNRKPEFAPLFNLKVINAKPADAS